MEKFAKNTLVKFVGKAAYKDYHPDYQKIWGMVGLIRDVGIEFRSPSTGDMICTYDVHFEVPYYDTEEKRERHRYTILSNEIVWVPQNA